MDKIKCFCGSLTDYQNCCGSYLEGRQNAPSAEALMRSRYTAYVLCKSAYLIETTHPKKRYLHNKKDIEAWALENKWLKLEMLETSETNVVFKAYFLDGNLQSQVHYESSKFEFLQGSWYYVEGKFL